MSVRTDDRRVESEARAWTLIVRTVALITAIVLFLVFAWTVRSVLILVVVAGVFAVALAPIVDAIAGVNPQRKWLRMPPAIALLLLYLVLIGAAIVFLAIVVPLIVFQVQQLAENLPRYIEQGRVFVGEHPVVGEFGERGLDQLQGALGQLSAQAGQVLRFLLDVASGLVTLVLLLVLIFYFVIEGASIRRSFLALVPAAERGRWDYITRAMSVKVSSWLQGQLLLSLIIGSVTYVGLLVIGLPYAALFAVIAAIGEVIPLLGPIVAAVPAVIVAFFISPTIGFLTLGLYVVIQQLENSLIVPMVMQRAVNLSPLVVMVALLLGAEVMGVVGAILAVPVAAMVSVLVAEIVKTRDSSSLDSSLQDPERVVALSE